MGTTKKGILVLDPRTKILLLLGINIYVFTNSYVVAEMLVMAALVVARGHQRLYGMGFEIFSGMAKLYAGFHNHYQ